MDKKDFLHMLSTLPKDPNDRLPTRFPWGVELKDAILTDYRFTVYLVALRDWEEQSRGEINVECPFPFDYKEWIARVEEMHQRGEQQIKDAHVDSKEIQIGQRSLETSLKQLDIAVSALELILHIGSEQNEQRKIGTQDNSFTRWNSKDLKKELQILAEVKKDLIDVYAVIEDEVRVCASLSADLKKKKKRTLRSLALNFQRDAFNKMSGALQLVHGFREGKDVLDEKPAADSQPNNSPPSAENPSTNLDRAEDN